MRGCATGRQVGERLYVIYEVGYDAGMSGAISGAASGSNRFLAMYRRSGTTLSETVVNLTREGPEAWSRLRTSGGGGYVGDEAPVPTRLPRSPSSSFPSSFGTPIRGLSTHQRLLTRPSSR